MDPLKYVGLFFLFFSQAKILRLPTKSLSWMVAKKAPKLRNLSEAAVEALKVSTEQHREEHHQSLPPHHDLTRWARPPPSKVQDRKRALGEDTNMLR